MKSLAIIIINLRNKIAWWITWKTTMRLRVVAVDWKGKISELCKSMRANIERWKGKSRSKTQSKTLVLSLTLPVSPPLPSSLETMKKNSKPPKDRRWLQMILQSCQRNSRESTNDANSSMGVGACCRLRFLLVTWISGAPWKELRRNEFSIKIQWILIGLSVKEGRWEEEE
jgi:hypothetical protein